MELQRLSFVGVILVWKVWERDIRDASPDFALSKPALTSYPINRVERVVSVILKQCVATLVWLLVRIERGVSHLGAKGEGSMARSVTNDLSGPCLISQSTPLLPNWSKYTPTLGGMEGSGPCD